MATFGKTDVGASEGAIVANYKIACRFQAGQSGTVTAIDAYLKAMIADRPMIAGIYEDDNGDPDGGALLGYSDELSIKDVAQWHHFPLISPVSVTKDEYYWLALLCHTDSKYYYDLGLTDQWARNNDTYYDGFCDPFKCSGTTVIRADVEVSIFALYEHELKTPSAKSSFKIGCAKSDFSFGLSKASLTAKQVCHSICVSSSLLCDRIDGVKAVGKTKGYLG